MTTPRPIQRQLEAAEALLAAQTAPQPAPQVLDNPSQLMAPASPQPVEQAPAPAPTPAPQENWEQRFRTVQGMYNAEVPQLRSRVASYESELVQLKQQVKALTEAAAAKPVEPRKLEVDPRDADAFGADMVQMVQRYAQQTYSDIVAEFGQHAAKLDARVKAIEEMVNGVSQKTETTLESQFLATLRQLVPDYETINESQEWRSWLAQADPVYRMPRQAALDRASGQYDAEGVAAIFKAFKDSRPAAPSAALAAQVSPGTSGGGYAPPQEPARQVITQKFVNTFFNDVAKGRYRGREEEAARIEQEINRAAAEGRIL